MPREYRVSHEREAPSKPAPIETSGGSGHGKRLLIIFAALALIAAGGYLIYSKFYKQSEPETPIYPIDVPEPEPEAQDKDNDGLTDPDEQRHATNASLADTDGDGLADGDEVNVYLSDPMLSDTDSDGYDDGGEVARGYSPIIKVDVKASASELQLWTENIEKFKLHEPTPTTLKLKASTAKSQSKVIYTNPVYKYSIELPAVLTFRETDESRVVGIYISGTNPEDIAAEDPINVSVAVKVAAQTLKEWINSQYAPADYEFLQEQSINSLATIRLVGIRNETCPQNKTFFIKDNIIIILTWTCNQNSPFAELYEQITQSFKFNK